MSVRNISLTLFAAFALLSCAQGGPPNEAEPTTGVGLEDGPATTPPTATDLIFCPEVQRRLPKEDCDDLTTVAAAARQGVAAFNVPPMERGKAATLQLAISFAPPEAEPADAAVANASASADAGANASASIEDLNDIEPSAGDSSGGINPDNEPVAGAVPPERPEDIVAQLPGEVESYKPVVGRFMRAALIGEGFTIKPLSKESQEVFINGSTTWEWSVTPLKAEKHVLTLKTVVEGVTADGKRFELRSTTRSRNVDVSLAWSDRLRDYLDETPGWIKAVTAVIAALTALFTAIKGLRALFRKAPADPSKP